MKNFKFLALIILIGLSSCQRATEPTSQLSLDLSTLKSEKMQSLTGSSTLSVLEDVLITISNTDGAFPVYHRFSKPTQVQLDVFRGGSILLQLLAVYKEGPFEDTKLFYSSTTVVLDQPEIQVSLLLENLGTLIDGSLKGRVFYQGQNIGPTGPVDIFFKKQSQLPGFLIDKSFIANGWFEFTSIEGLSSGGLEYRVTPQALSSGVDISLFGSPKQLSDFASGNHAIRVSVPPSQIMQFNSYRALPPENFMLGVWELGGQARGGYLIHKDTSSPWQNRKRLRCTNRSTCLTASSLGHVTDETSSIETVRNLQLTMTYVDDAYLGSESSYSWGGQSETSCTEVTEWNSCLRHSISQIDTERNHNRMGGIKGLIRLQKSFDPGTCSPYVYPCESFRLNKATNSIQFLPGIIANQAQLWYQSLSATNNTGGSDKLTCLPAELSQKGYQLLTNYQLSLAKNGINLTSLPNDTKQALICLEIAGHWTPRPIILNRRELNLSPDWTFETVRNFQLSGPGSESSTPSLQFIPFSHLTLGQYYARVVLASDSTVVNDWGPISNDNEITGGFTSGTTYKIEIKYSEGGFSTQVDHRTWTTPDI